MTWLLVSGAPGLFESAARSGPIGTGYSITSLGSNPGPYEGTTWDAWNSSGVWIGNMPAGPSQGSTATEPVAWINGKFTQLAGSSLGYTSAVNDSGEIVGGLYSSVASSSQTTNANNQAFVYNNGTLFALGTFGHQASGASAISNNGQIAIWVQDGNNASGTRNALIDNNGTVTQVPAPVPNAFLMPTAINNAGQVIGQFTAPDLNSEHAFLYSAGKTIDLGALQNSPNLSNSPAALSSNGIVVGESSTDSTWHGAMGAYIYQNGVMTAIPAYQGNEFLPRSVNAQGEVVGSVLLANNSILSLLYNSQTGSYVALNSLIPSSSQWGNLIGTEIDDQGRIYGYSVVNGQQDLFVLFPDGPGPENPVPEPSTWLVFITLAGSVIVRKRFAALRARVVRSLARPAFMSNQLST